MHIRGSMGEPDVYDVVIVGTGPGGGMAACRLAGRGLNALVLEKEHLPRPKACGGAMPGDIRNLLDWSIEPLIRAEVSTQLHRYDYSDPARHIAMPDPMILVDRPSFDRHFIDRAVRMGAGRLELRQGVSVRSATEDEDGVTLTLQDGETVRARYVIAADGASSIVARSVGLYLRSAGAAVDAAVYVTEDVFAGERDRATFNVHCVEAGYGWIFPKDDHLSCGVGMWRRPRKLLDELNTFLERSLPEGSITRIERLSHPVPVFQGHHPVATRRICLVGDAAQMVDPVLGEGIRYAIQAGRLAADVISALCAPELLDEIVAAPTGMEDDLATLLARQGDCGTYNTIVRHTIARELNLIRLNGQGFLEDPEAVYSALVA